MPLARLLPLLELVLPDEALLLGDALEQVGRVELAGGSDRAGKACKQPRAMQNASARARKQRSPRLPHPPRVDTMVVVEYKGRRHTFKPSPSAPASELLEAALSAPQLGAPGVTGATSPHTRPSAWPSGAWLLVRACGRAAD